MTDEAIISSLAFLHAYVAFEARTKFIRIIAGINAVILVAHRVLYFFTQ